MKNLKLLKKNYFDINIKVLSSCLSNDFEDGLFCLTNESIIFSNGKELKNIVPDVCDPFVSVQNGMSLYCASENSVISYDNFDGTKLDSLELDENIISFSLSPDASILMVLTNTLNFMVLSNELEVLTTFYLEQTGFGTAEPQSIGWGKKETQFHGKIGKEARNIIEKVNEQSAFDSNESMIAWKQDGDYFAISWITSTTIQSGSSSGTRLIRIFSKDGDLFSTSEPTNVLENGLFWRTKSNLIATSCRNNQGLDVVFFEQNGLRRGGFSLYEAGKCENKAVSSISFNSNDDICAVVIQDMEQNITQVEMFTTDNYHWYKKQVLHITNSLEPITLLWSMDNLHIMSESGHHSTYQWYSEIDRSIVANYTGANTSFKLPNLVAVIDGDKLLMTPFECGVIPPPYCAFTINFPANVSFVSLPTIEEINDNSISCFVQASNKVYWLRLVKESLVESCNVMPTTLQFGTSRSLYIPIIEAVQELENPVNTIHWIDNTSFYCVCGNELYLYRLENSTILHEKLPTGDILVGKICYNTQLYIEDIFGQVYRFDQHGCLNPLFKYSSFCSEIYSVKMKSETDDVVVSYSSVLNQLFINGCLQTGSYMSMLPIKNHLLLTNCNQKLRCINLEENSLSNLIHLLDEKNYKCNFDFDETFRLIEPGTKIITCVPCDSRIILMMPRGNLETIFPRALVLDDLKLLMDKGLYSEAVEKMRRQRVNLNLLYDHSPQMFMDNLDKLVTDNAKNDRLVLFLSELSTEDVTETMYKRFYNLSNRVKSTLNGCHKVNIVCSAVAKLVENELNDDYLNLILTCYVKMSPSASNKALQLLRTFKDNGKTKMWDKGLKYLQYLISIDDLYRVALSTYDLKLTLQVAQKTQLDPKEYVSFINDLDELPCEQYRRFKINIFLKKPVLALEFISKVCDIHWDETVELIKANSLYVKALELFAPKSTQYNSISAMFAEHLISKSSDLKAAGMVYLRTGDADLCKLAANCFLKTLHWKEWIIASKKSNMDAAEFNSSLTIMSVRLKDIGRFSEAMFINEIYLNNLSTAFNIALEGRLFADANRILASISDSTDEVTKMNVTILKTYNNFTSQLEDSEKKYQDNLNRLVEVRTNFVEKFNEMALAGEDEILNDFMSDTSGASSVSSRSSMHSKISNFSMNSSKQHLKKKKVKKQWSDKIGSQKEEIGLIENLYFNIKNLQSLIPDINSLVEILCYNGCVDKANLLIGTTNRLLALHSNTTSTIWDEFLINMNFELNEDEIQISNHIKVSRGPKFTGRRRYLFDESFLRSIPQMTIFSIAYAISGM